ncbi:nuclear transport factor 2 family protein [Pseudonocardia acidicola]|uniref:SnoaL-like domain-containing protein n=1 Tax=Pseudonocardia acidicola TaxID=2724939 RepID=A0ABX1SBG8_9PSEU|nr:nuclear transport factor 2 family protein [Pseudonocardia acidicola]NMH98207.1 SnoaL-like domain-containing protein [Pseudonocardia acidicola]
MTTATELHPAAKASWKLLADRVEQERDPRHRANLEVVARHVEEEVRGDMDALMATLVPEPQYRIWGASSSTGPKGHAEVVAHYQAMFDSGKSRLEYEVTRVVVDDDTVVTEGIFRHAYTGATLAGRVVAADEVDLERWYLVEYHALVVWPIGADGLIEGEEIYAGEPPRIVRALEPGECPHLGPVDRS